MCRFGRNLFLQKDLGGLFYWFHFVIPLEFSPCWVGCDLVLWGKISVLASKFFRFFA
jgi:hypothetical protein